MSSCAGAGLSARSRFRAARLSNRVICILLKNKGFVLQLAPELCHHFPVPRAKCALSSKPTGFLKVPGSVNGVRMFALPRKLHVSRPLERPLEEFRHRGSRTVRKPRSGA